MSVIFSVVHLLPRFHQLPECLIFFGYTARGLNLNSRWASENPNGWNLSLPLRRREQNNNISRTDIFLSNLYALIDTSQFCVLRLSRVLCLETEHQHLFHRSTDFGTRILSITSQCTEPKLHLQVVQLLVTESNALLHSS